MDMYVRATKTSLYNLIQDCTDVNLPIMKKTEFTKHKHSYWLEFEDYSFYLSVCCGVARLYTRQDNKEKNHLIIPFQDLLNRNMVIKTAK